MKEAKSLTTSYTDRQKILSNEEAAAEMQRNAGAAGIPVDLSWDGRVYVTHEMAASCFAVDRQSVSSCVEQNAAELEQNGYRILKGGCA